MCVDVDVSFLFGVAFVLGGVGLLGCVRGCAWAVESGCTVCFCLCMRLLPWPSLCGV